MQVIGAISKTKCHSRILQSACPPHGKLCLRQAGSLDFCLPASFDLLRQAGITLSLRDSGMRNDLVSENEIASLGNTRNDRVFEIASRKTLVPK
jgi:hypothetical protein